MKKLRNKKTGEIQAFGNLQVYAEAENSNESQFFGNFNSFKQIFEYYEDYIPKEPLIKDEKIRKAVRAWVEANDKRVFEVQVCYQSYGDGSWSLRDTTHEEDCGLAFIGEIPEGLNLGSRYTIAELCGEEKE